jgi:hypothetical protein
VIVKITANLRVDGESRRHRQLDPRHLVKVCAFASKQSFHFACSVSVAVPEVINVTRRARSFGSRGFARFRSQRLPGALKWFSKVRFSFRSHKISSGGSRRNDEAPN